MTKLAQWKGHCTSSTNGQQALHNIIVEAINAPQAKMFLESRYPGYGNYYISSRVSGS